MRAMLRARGEAPVTNAELFFDLVYVFAVTQVSHHLLNHATARGALQALLLLAIVWLAWAYTTWTTNWLDPERLPVRGMLMLAMLASLLMAAGLPAAFDDRGLLVAAAYVAMQVLRSVFVVFATGGDALQRNFQRILTWSIVSGGFYLAGGFAEGHAREVLWLIGVLIDLAGGAFGFYVPGLGRSRTVEWTIEGGHFAERCQLFVMIALGESIVLIGSTLADLHPIKGSQVVAFVGALAGSVALWWIYFDRSAGDAAHVIAGSDDPGRLGRSAYHWVHPVMIGGIVVVAASDERVLAHPGEHDTTTTRLVMGGVALFLVGHALFKAVVWRVVPWTRLGAAALAVIWLLVDPDVSALTVGIIALVLVAAVAVTDRLLPPQASMLSQAVRSSSSTSDADGGPLDPAS